MPIYVFKCKEHALFEEMHPMSQAPSEAKCPECDEVCKRYYGQMSFITKGGGWPSKDIRVGKSLPQAKELNDVMNARQKAGLNPGKEKPMSDEEFKRRKALNERWLEETK